MTPAELAEASARLALESAMERGADAGKLGRLRTAHLLASMDLAREQEQARRTAQRSRRAARQGRQRERESLLALALADTSG